MSADTHIKTETGIRMLQSVGSAFFDDPYQLAIFNANGLIMEEVHQAADRLMFEVLINEATWSLPYWEQLFRIKAGDRQTIEERRRAVVLKMNEYFPVTRKRMESIISAYTEHNGVSIDDKRGNYIFEVFLRNSGKFDFSGATEAIEETKPAHLDYQYHLINDDKWVIGGALLGAESTIIYPFVDPDVDITGDLLVAGAMYETESVEMEGEFL